MQRMSDGQVATLLRELEFQDLAEQGATWKLDPKGDPWMLANAADELLWIQNEGHTNKSGQVTISALLPFEFRMLFGVDSLVFSTINVKLDRGTGAIANAIVTRLLPAYRVRMGELRQRKEAKDREWQEHLDLANRFASILKAPPLDSLMPLIEAYDKGTEGAKRLYVSVSPLWNGGCNLSLNGVPNDLVEQILRLVVEGRQRIER